MHSRKKLLLRFSGILIFLSLIMAMIPYSSIKVEASGEYKTTIILNDVSTAAKITRQPTDKTAVYGNIASFTVQATGSNLKYQWQYSTNSGSSWNDSSATGNRSAILKVTATKQNNNVLYRCKVTGGGKTIYSVDAKLTSLPIITVQPKNATAICGSNATFYVETRASNATYQWQYSSNGYNWTNSSASGRRSRGITICSSSSNSGFYYRCIVKNGNVTQISSSARLNVKPKITTQPTNKTAIAGNKVSFKVVANGGGLTYQWQYSTNGTTWKNSSSSGNKTSVLQVVTSESNNNFKYRCIVKSGSLSVISKAATLSVKPKPIYLTTLTPYEKDWFVDKHNVTIQNTYGNSYEHSITIRSYTTSASDLENVSADITYLINSKYNHLDVTLGYDADPDYSDYTDRNGYVIIFADEKIIYKSATINSNTKPIKVSLDLGNNTNMLKFAVITDNRDYRYAPIMIGSPKVSYKTN